MLGLSLKATSGGPILCRDVSEGFYPALLATAASLVTLPWTGRLEIVFKMNGGFLRERPDCIPKEVWYIHLADEALSPGVRGRDVFLCSP